MTVAMSFEHSSPVGRHHADAPPLSAWWRHGGALGALAVAILLVFHRDVADIVGIWWTSSTFGHCLLIPPILGWLVGQRWPELRRLAPRAWAPGLLVVAAGGFGWLLGEAAGVALARHFGLLLMLVGAVIAVMGPAVSRGLAFPLFYMAFLVPFGEELVPPLQTVTAHICMTLLDLAGIPAHIEGVFISIPNGYFEVAEACSGVKFLIAMLAYGALVANVCFVSWPRRIAFMAAAVIVPVLANGLRAWGTIWFAHMTTADAAVGFDHVIYGWVFFAIVMALVMAVGWPFFDRGVDDPWFDPARLQAPGTPSAPPVRLYATAMAALALVLLPVGWSALAAQGQADLPARAILPDVPGWTKIPAGGTPWRPHYDGADRLLTQRYRDDAGRTVDLAVAVYARQGEGRELVGYGQGAVGPDSRWAWMDDTADPAGGIAFRITAPGPVIREVATFYRIGDTLTGSETRVKLETLRSNLIGGPKHAVAVLVSAEQDGNRSARPGIDRFLRALGPVDAVADRVAGAGRAD